MWRATTLSLVFPLVVALRGAAHYENLTVMTRKNCTAVRNAQLLVPLLLCDWYGDIRYTELDEARIWHAEVAALRMSPFQAATEDTGSPVMVDSFTAEVVVSGLILFPSRNTVADGFQLISGTLPHFYSTCNYSSSMDQLLWCVVTDFNLGRAAVCYDQVFLWFSSVPFQVCLEYYYKICHDRLLPNTVRSLIKLNATVTSWLPAGTAWLSAKRYEVFFPIWIKYRSIKQ
jgi:hypothetical protein